MVLGRAPGAHPNPDPFSPLRLGKVRTDERWCDWSNGDRRHDGGVDDCDGWHTDDRWNTDTGNQTSCLVSSIRSSSFLYGSVSCSKMCRVG